MKVKYLAVIMLMVTLVLVGCSIDKSNKVLKIENYNRIIIDESTYEDVVNILGKPNGETKINDGSGIILWMNNRQTKSISVTFSNNIAIVKQQSGLLDEHTF